MLSDIQFGLSQEAMGEELNAGLCYMFITLVAIFSIGAMPVIFKVQHWTEGAI